MRLVEELYMKKKLVRYDECSLHKPYLFSCFFLTSRSIYKSKQLIRCRNIRRVCKSRSSFCVDLTLLSISDAGGGKCRKTRFDLSCGLQGIQVQNHSLRKKVDWPHSFLTCTHTISSRIYCYFMLWPTFRLQRTGRMPSPLLQPLAYGLIIIVKYWPLGYANSCFVLL